MPPKAGKKHGGPSHHGHGGGAPKPAQTKKHSTTKPKHSDPYAAATGKTLDDLVKDIEATAGSSKKGKTTTPPPTPQAHHSQPVSHSDHGATEHQPASTRGARKKQKKKEKSSETGSPAKTGMTKAQRRELQKKRREAAMGRALPNREDFEEEDEENDDGGGHNSDEDYSDTQNERAKEYRKGGYHPVAVGEVYNNRYRVVKKLGWGYFSTVWLVWDYVTSTYQAMKVQKSADHYREAAFDEIRLLSEIMSADVHRDRCCARMNDYFEHVGPNGTHVCMVFDVLGENLLNLLEWYEYRGIPLPIVKAIAQQVLIGLEHIHGIQILHTDLKPENVLLSTPKHKVISIMKHYRPPPLHHRASLLSRDVKTMTKSQKRRYYQKLKKVGGGKQSSNDKGSADSGDDDESKQSTTSTPSPSTTAAVPLESMAGFAASGYKPSTGDGGGDAFDGGAAAPPPPPSSSGHAIDASGLPADDQLSDTDPEWEIERFHHVSLADFGNSCWTYRQFTDEVQTRQYRSPEVILGCGYSTPIDLWSAACMFFELITGEFLFDPKLGDNYSREEDHLALMTELLGELPEHMRLGSGKYRSQFYNSRGELRNIKELKFWCLQDLLHEKYRFTRKKAAEISEFLLPMLALDPNERATATEMLNHFQHFFEVQDDDYAPYCYVVAGDGADSHHDEDEDENVDDADDEDAYDSDEDRGPRLERRGKRPSGQPGRCARDGGDDGRRRSVDNGVDHGNEVDADEDDDDGEEEQQRLRHARASSADAEELRQYWMNHPLLNEGALQRRGLAIKDVQLALQNIPLETDEKQEEVEKLLIELQQLEIAGEEDDAGEDAEREDEAGKVVRHA